MRAIIIFLAGCMLISCAQTNGARPGKPVFHSNPVFAEKGYPFSDAVEANGLIFLSGQIGTLPGSDELISGGIEAEARQTMENIKSSLERLGLSFDDVVKCTVMIDNMENWPAFNAIYAGYFNDEYPARSAFGADGLALGAAVEVECIAKR
jgi:2-iminobutanoate/2-iminopropanoate deaminase